MFGLIAGAIVNPTIDRRYLHGDAKEGEPGVYYCSKHDLFVPLEHFYEGCNVENDYERYSGELKRLGGRPRPEGAENAFA